MNAKNKMNFNLTPPSLEHRALIKTAIMLCDQGDRRDLMSKLSLLSYQKILKTVSENVTMIPLPSLLKEKLFAIIEAVILQKQSWILFHMYRYKFITEFPIKLVWTAQGTIDYKRTAEAFVRDKTIEVEKRYNLACIYCLEDHILELQGEFRHLKCNTADDILITYWSNYEKENEHHFARVNSGISYHEFFFGFSAVMLDNEVSLRYFSTKLTPENADNLKMQTAEHVANMLRHSNARLPGTRCNDILYFLLTTMNEDQQTKLFQKYTYEVLRSLLVWPRQSLFLEVVKENFKFLSENKYCLLLCDIAGIMVNKRSYLREIFFEFWQQSPKSYKQFVTDGDGIGGLLDILYKKECERNIQIIFKDSSISAKKNLIFSDVGQDILKSLVYSEKWNSVRYLIQGCTSLQEMTEFKDQFTQNITVLRSGKRFAEDHRWNKFLRMIENFIIMYKKRKFIEDYTVSFKKMCCKHIQK